MGVLVFKYRQLDPSNTNYLNKQKSLERVIFVLEYYGYLTY